MKRISLTLGLALIGFLSQVNHADAGSFNVTGTIQVVSVVKASATRQLKFNIAVTPHRSITVTSAAPVSPSVAVNDIQKGVYKVHASKESPTVNLTAEDVGNVKGVKLTDIESQYGDRGTKTNLLDNAVASLIPPTEKDEELRVELAMLKIDPLKVPGGAKELNPEVHLDVSYE